MPFVGNKQGKPRKWKLDSRTPLQDIIFSIDDLTEYTKKTTRCEMCGRHTSEVLQVFCSKSSLHGLRYVGEKGNTLIRIFWAMIIILALGTSIYHICKLYKKWEETPVMVTIAPRVKNIKELNFPAVTICAPKILTTKMAKKFNITFTNKNKSREIVCNGSNPDQNESDGILDKYTSLPCNILLGSARFSSRDISQNITSSKVLLEKSVRDCCTFNGLSEENMYRNLNFTKKKNNIMDEKSLLKPNGIGVNNKFTYTFNENIECPKNFEFMISIHHPTEAPNVEGDGLRVKTGAEISFTVKPQDTQASDSLKNLKPEIRGCQFPEDVYLRFYKTYSQYNCQLDCLANYTIQKCGCLPPYLPENNGTLNVCDASDECFVDAVVKRIEIQGACQCEQPCQETMYLVTTQFLGSKKNTTKLDFDVYFTEPTYFTYHRSETYGLSDFLSNCGGLLGLFMGFSVISMVELFYFSSYGIWRLMSVTFRRKDGSR